MVVHEWNKQRIKKYEVSKFESQGVVKNEKNKESKLIYAKYATKASSCKALYKQNVYQCYIKGVYKFPNMTVRTWTNEEG